MKKIIALTVVLLAFTTNIFAQDGHSCCQAKSDKKTEKSCHVDDGSNTTPNTKIATKDINVTLKVQGKCDMCKANIENAAKSVDGVSAATWNAKKKELSLAFNSEQTDIDAISKAIAFVGYDTEKDKADKKTYDALPGCCKYRR